MLDGFSVDDPDLDVDLIKVAISTAASTGRLTLNEGALEMVGLLPCRNIYNMYVCIVVVLFFMRG